MGDSNGDQRVEIDELVAAVRNALSGCPDTQPDGLRLWLSVVPSEEAGGLKIVARLRHEGSRAVAYLTGCSAVCRPSLYTGIYFTVIGPSGAEVFLERPCGGPFFCAPRPTTFSPGDEFERELRVTGSEWLQENVLSISYCGDCTEQPLTPGRYVVVARFPYSTDVVQPSPFSEQVVALTEFRWP